MSIFNLPDLGEGLPDAEICEWHIKIGDTVTTDQPIVSMETAKAFLDKADIVVTPGNGFGEQGEGYIRMTLTVSKDRINEAVTRLQKVL